MIERLRIKDFQSIGDLDVQCGPITVFHGESDTGKSALVRALYALAYNEYPRGHVRDGASESAVEIEVDGVHVGAYKGSGTNVYEVGHRQFDKVGAGVPDEVRAVLGWPVLELDDGIKFTPSFQLQFDPPFLLTDTPSRKAKVLGTLTNVATLYAAIREANAWERKAKTRADTQREIIDGAQARIEELESSLAGEKGSLRELMQVVLLLSDRGQTADRLTLKMVGLATAQETVGTLRDLIKMLRESDPTEIVHQVEKRLAHIKELEAVAAGVAAATVLVRDSETNLERMREGLITVEATLSEFMAEHKVCPMCGNEWGEVTDG